MDECKPLARGGAAREARDKNGVRRDAPGKAMQIDPIKPTLKPPGIKLVKLKFDTPLSNFAFSFNMRRYN